MSPGKLSAGPAQATAEHLPNARSGFGAGLQSRLDRWVLGKLRRESGPITVARRRVYIVPTRFGFGFAFMTLVMLLGAMNYSNSMAYALTFLLVGIGLVGMHHTHANLVNVGLRCGRVPAVFAGETAHFEVVIDNPSIRPRLSLGLGWARAPAQSFIDVPAQGFAEGLLSTRAEPRGWLPAPVFSVSTDFPLGLFRAWTWAELDMAVLVYPKPAERGSSPPASEGGTGRSPGNASGQDEFAGLRAYQAGDPLRSIHWKSLPKSGQLMVKQFSDTTEDDLWLDFDSLPGLAAEDRLSQLARWVLDAEEGHRSYGVKLAGLRIEPSRGEHHRHLCLKALALHTL